MLNLLLTITAVAWCATAVFSPVKIPAGRFAPLFGLDKGQTSFPVSTFWLDRLPVTVRDLRAFLRTHPEWAPGKVARVYADESYLKNLSKQGPDEPAVYVSWFLADAYCAEKSGRLPTVLEWEYAGATGDPDTLKKILQWYANPRSAVSAHAVVGASKPGPHGLYNMHGLVWEWTADFNSFFVSGDNRSDGDQNKDMFCGNGATGSAERENYAAFMRYAMRSSLKADFALENLGFRCAYDIEPAKKGKKP